MKSIPRFLIFALALISAGAHASPVATTVGSNLTAYNPGFGATNNNNWNILTNPRSGAESAPTADFGNCNALILRCAQPKCANGGCTDMDVTSAIVSGCVNSNDTCKQHGDELVKYISAQLVAQSTAKSNQAATAAQTAATQQNNQQMQAMQQQMAALQQQIADSNASMQAALQAQQESTAAAIANASASAPTPSVSSSSDVAESISTELTTAQRVAAESNVSEDLILRETISGEILTQINNAENSLKTLKATMQTVFDYAGCDSRGDNCTGPKRVKKFKDLAGEFFDPYEDVLDDLYEAIILSQSVGVDVSNIYMLLNNSCDRWAKYACSKPLTYAADLTTKQNIYVWPRYSDKNCSASTGKSIPGAEIEASASTSGISYSLGSVRGGMECYKGQTIPPEDDTSCTMIQVLSGDDARDVARGYLYPDEGDMGDMVRVGCASNALKGSWLFRGKKQQASITIETLRRIVEQDNSQISFTRQSKTDLGQKEQLKYCALTESGYMSLQKYVGLRGLPTSNICVNERTLNKNMDRVYIGESDSIIQMARDACETNHPASNGGTSNPAFSEILYKCFCSDASGNETTVNCDRDKSQDALTVAEKRICERQYGGVYFGGTCHCEDVTYPEDRELCEIRFKRPSSSGTGSSTKKPLPASCVGRFAVSLPGGPTNTYDADKCCRDRGGDPLNGHCFCGGYGTLNMMISDTNACIGGKIETDIYER